jgi:hypothetical protein
MKKPVFLLAVLGLLMLTCSKKNITNNYYYGPEEEGASIVGVVYPPESEAIITVYLGIPVASTQIDAVGYFKFSGLPAGSYSLVVQATGYYVETRGAYVNQSVATVLDTVYLAPIGHFVFWVSPYNGQQMVDVDAPIRVAFRTEIDRESFENALLIDPAVKGMYRWREYYPPGGPPEVQFYPGPSLATSTLYRVVIDTTVTDTSGVRLAEPYEFQFTTEPLRVMMTYPAHNDLSVSPRTDVTVGFNAQMDRESAEAAFRLVNSELEEVTGYFSWSSSTYMRFQPNSPLAAEEEYTATIEATASDANGSKLRAPYWFSFTTGAVMVTSASPPHKSTLVPTSTDVKVAFNTDMDRESLISGFQIMDSQLKIVTGELSWPTAYYLQFQPDSLLANNETYTVTINTSAKDLYGKHLKEPFSFWFKTAPE